MFEGDWSELDAAATLDAAVECDAAENHAALGKLHAALQYADLHGELSPRSQAARTKPGRERLKVYGGDGCTAVAEFAPAEFAAVLGLTTRSGTALLGEALALRHRFPRLWASTLAGNTLVWRARAVARGCLKLSLEAALWVDQRIVGKIGGLSTTKFYDLLDALITQADPAAARRAAEEHARERGVFVNPSDGEGTKTIYVKAATGDVIRFDATVCDLAWALAMMGDTDTADQRRAKAIGWIADPAAAYELLNAARYLATQQHHGPTTPGAACQDTCTGTGQDTGTGDTGTSDDTADTADTATDTDPGTDAGAGTDVGPVAGLAPDITTNAGAGGVGDDHAQGSADPTDPDTPHRATSQGPAQGTDGSPADAPGGRPATDPATSHPGTGEEPVHEQTTPATREQTTPAAHGQVDSVARFHGDEWVPGEEPGPDDEADRDTPHPSVGGHLDHLDTLTTRDILNMIEREAWRHPRPPTIGDPDDSATAQRQGTRLPTSPTHTDGTTHTDSTGHSDGTAASENAANSEGAGREEAFSRRGLADRLAAIKRAAHTTGLGTTSGTRRRPRTELYVHLTDQTLQTGDGIIRAEQHGVLLASQLRELLGHDQVVLKPVIDLAQQIAVDCYEIPHDIRERVKLTHPVEQFPYGTTETTLSTDLDHIVAYDPTGPPEQTSTTNLSPAGRFHHRLKTHSAWRVEPLEDGALLWTTPNGYQFRVDQNGTHRITNTDQEPDDQEPDDQ